MLLFLLHAIRLLAVASQLNLHLALCLLLGKDHPSTSSAIKATWPHPCRVSRLLLRLNARANRLKHSGFTTWQVPSQLMLLPLLLVALCLTGLPPYRPSALMMIPMLTWSWQPTSSMAGHQLLLIMVCLVSIHGLSMDYV